MAKTLGWVFEYNSSDGFAELRNITPTHLVSQAVAQNWMLEGRVLHMEIEKKKKYDLHVICL